MTETAVVFAHDDMAAPDVGGVLAVRGVRRTFEAELAPVRALRGVDLDVARGEFVAVMGPSGCGKSTLLNLVAGLDVADDGTIVLAGEEITGRDEDWLARMRRRHIGIVFQFFNLLEGMTALENVVLPGGAGRHRSARPRRAGPGTCSTCSGSATRRTSCRRCSPAAAPAPRHRQGARQRADAAAGRRADRRARHRWRSEVLELFRRLHVDGQTIIMVTHSDEVAGGADRIVSMRDGRMVT